MKSFKYLYKNNIFLLCFTVFAVLLSAMLSYLISIAFIIAFIITSFKLHIDFIPYKNILNKILSKKNDRDLILSIYDIPKLYNISTLRKLKKELKKKNKFKKKENNYRKSLLKFINRKLRKIKGDIK